MFRPIARKKQQLSQEECLKILTETKRGVLSVIGDGGYPYGMPLNHYYDPSDGKIYFHGGKTGHKIDALRKCDKVSYCVIDDGVREADEWFLRFRSVIVFGRMDFVGDEEKTAQISRLLSYKFTEDDEYIEEEIRRSLNGTLLLALTPEHICGKRVREK